MRDKFWERYSLAQLSPKEWEALCDGCGQCCLVRHVDEHKVSVFNISCDLLDINTSRCSNYKHRLSHVPHCHPLTAETVPQYDWLPESCAYRRLHKGLPLASWHPLIAGSRQRMRELGVTVSASAQPSSQVPRHQRSRHLIKIKNL